jgi:electron transfer flavoprotein beta subunit
MRLLVCVKQVPDPDSALVPADDRNRAVPENGAYAMNRLDAYALEEALAAKDADPGIFIRAVSAGPFRAESVLRRALAMGADAGLHVVQNSEAPLTGLEVAALIAGAVGGMAFDCVLCGAMSEDDSAGQVGPMLAALLDMTCATNVVFLEFLKKRLRAKRESEGGVLEEILLDLPALLTIQSTKRRPRYPTLSHLLRANRQELDVVNEKDLIKPAPREAVLGISPPGPAVKGVFLEGSAEEKAGALCRILRERALL